MSRREPHISSSGMTLVEIILVISIIGISMGVALPMIVRKPGPTELRIAAATIQSLVRYARNSSIARGLPHRLSYDREKGRFSMEVEDSPVDSPGEFTDQKLPPSVGKEIKPGDVDVTIEFGDSPDRRVVNNGEITFYPDGSTVDTLIHVTAREDGRSYTVVIIGATGVSFTKEEVVEFSREKGKE